MSPAHVLEPTYCRLKRALMEGAWRGGTKLEAMRLADDFGVSMTPVRDSLNQLVGEGLVDLTPGEGFRVHVLTEQALRDILNVNALLLETSLSENTSTEAQRDDQPSSDTYPDRLAAAYLGLARGSGNGYLAYLVDRINERLHPVRKLEPQVLPKAIDMLNRIEASLTATRGEQLEAIRRYHEQCRSAASQLISLL
ncbi:GntR family transcriptional regulator [Croceicoccus sp. YJ47]|uniref:GntR family transcriptional regulator n=1 Tax=Croceicoccus sp. YJ47 TaxID=2798724 RepID=UPI0019221A7D|nr:GntR family transcriptional regulator [Croceicoccus sp. YJ47]QQN75138.1 GntR family transcriptional regulator [Croceicoccus sp. YJ47]